MVRVYVSYAWKEEQQNQLVAKLEAACAARGINLERDIRRIDYGQSIRAFMDELGAAYHIILVLSERYFRSEYCMYELLGIYKNCQFRQRVLPIVLRDTRIHRPVDRIPFLKHWQDETDELERQLATLSDPKFTQNLRASLDHYADFRRMIDELLHLLNDMNALTEDVHLDTDFAALLARIAPPQDEFRTQIGAEILAILNRHSTLRTALENQLQTSGLATSTDLVTTLCSLPPDQAIGHLLYPATKHCLSTPSTNFEPAWRAAQLVMAWLTLLAVDHRQSGSPRKQTLPNGMNTFELIVHTPLGVEIVHAHSWKILPELSVRRSGVVGRNASQLPAHESGWSDDAAFDDLLLAIWHSVFPEETRASLSTADRKNLKSTLRFRRKHKTHHHYLAVPPDTPSPLTRPAFYERFTNELPDLAVIYFHGEGGPPALLISDEVDFMVTIREFLTLPELLKSKP